MCIMILDGVKNQFDVHDIVCLQKFVIKEFTKRHQANLVETKKQADAGKEMKKYKIDHVNMASA